MNISKEIKTGILAIVAIFLLIYGYSFLKGSNIFSNERVFFVTYENVAGLALSAPVTVNGHVIGKVKKIGFANNQGGLIVTFALNKEFEFSKNSIVEIYSTSFIGGNALAIKPVFDDKDLAQTGDTLKGSIQK
ncbi:MAG: MCE family protein, partial [Bacteroidetes bacterium]|nr:MCE family protein [Bacteroidota bacterium]